MKILLLSFIIVSVAAIGGTHTVTIEGMKFSPQSLTVKSGETVRWINKDFFPHTVTSHSFDSKSIEASGSWSLKAIKAGSFNYKCNFHPTMEGKLIILK